MASPPVLAFDAEGRPVKFETWLDDLHLFLQLTAKEDISLYDHALGHATALAATADSTARSQWQTRDAHARFAIRNSLPIDEREHFGQHKTAQALYTAFVARYSSPASAALGRLSLPYLFPDLASFHTVADLITHLRTSEARFRAAMPDEFLAKNPPPLWLTLYHLVTRLPDTLRSVRDHFLARCPTELTIALLEKKLLAAEASIVAVGASHGDPRTPFFEGCSPSPLLPSVASAAAVDLLSTEKVGTASGSSGRRSGKGKGAREVAVTAGEAVVGEVVAVVVVARLEGQVAAVGVVAAAAGEVAGAAVVEGVAADAAAAGVGVVEEVAAAVVVVEALAVARASSTLRRPRRSVSGTLSTGEGVALAARMSFALVTALASRVGDRTPHSAASLGLTTLGVVKRPPGSPPVFKARYVARGFSQRQGVDYFQTFSPTPKMTTLRVLLHVAAHRDYELHSLDFSTAFLQGSLHEEIWLRRPPGFTGTSPPDTQWSLRRPVYGLRQAPREWHDTLRTTLAALGFAPSTADPSLFLRTDTSLPPFYILVYVDDLVFATADTAGLAYVKSELQKRHTCTDMGELRSYLGLQITRDRAHRTITLTQSHMVQ
ncbi:unnamed protein product [Closterium sp. NIES-53]